MPDDERPPFHDFMAMDHDETAGSASSAGGWNWQEGDEPVPGYLVWGRLSEGPRFETWLAWCRDRLTPVVVKVPRPYRVDGSALQALEREQRATAAMDHPAIPRVYAADLDAPLPHLVLEFIEGRPLSSLLADRGGFDRHDTVVIGLQLAAALRHVHGRGFVHLDLKPSNISLRGDRVFLLDFDLALEAGTPQTPGRPRGTPGYMAPEQIGCQPADPLMDLFTLGAVLFEVATAQPLFSPVFLDGPQGESEAAPSQLARYARPDLSALTPELAAVIAALVFDEPARRPIDAGRVIELLEHALPAGTERLWPPWVTAAVIGSRRRDGAPVTDA